MAGSRRACLTSLLVILLLPAGALGAEFKQDVERDFALRSIGQLQVTNLRGNITIQGWALDKVRVRATRQVEAPTEEEARKLFPAADFRFRAIDHDIELSAEYWRGMTIEERLKERAQPRTRMNMTVFAPANLKLRVWAAEGEVVVKAWKTLVEVRTGSGPIGIEHVQGGTVALLCPSCKISVKNVKGSLRCMAGSGDVSIADIEGDHVYAETNGGAIRASAIRAEQLYVTKSGPVEAKNLKGRIEFHTADGAVRIAESEGFVSGRTDSGDIDIRMRSWRFEDKAIIESTRGSVAVGLPASLSAELELSSIKGKSDCDFPYQLTGDSRLYGPEPANLIRARIGKGGEQLRIASQQGNARLFRLF